MHDMADNTAPAAEHADSPAKPRLSADAKWIVATGVALGLLLITLISTMLLQNATINARIDDTNNNVRGLQTEIRERHADTQTDIRELRGLLLQLLERSAPANPVN